MEDDSWTFALGHKMEDCTFDSDRGPWKMTSFGGRA